MTAPKKPSPKGGGHTTPPPRKAPKHLLSGPWPREGVAFFPSDGDLLRPAEVQRILVLFRRDQEAARRFATDLQRTLAVHTATPERTTNTPRGRADHVARLRGIARHAGLLRGFCERLGVREEITLHANLRAVEFRLHDFARLDLGALERLEEVAASMLTELDADKGRPPDDSGGELCCEIAGLWEAHFGRAPPIDKTGRFVSVVAIVFERLGLPNPANRVARWLGRA